MDDQPVAETIEVVGRTPDAASRYPGATTVVTREEIESLAPQSANDVLRRVEGVHVVDEDGVGLRPNIGIRGLPPARTTKVLILEDGVPIAPGPYGHPELYYVPSIERIDAIEVVRGSGIVRFGPQTVGGVVNFLTAPVPDAGTEADVELQHGAYGWWLARGMAGAGTDVAGWRVDAFHKRYGGPRGIDLVASDATGRLEASVGDARFVAKTGVYREEAEPTYLGLTTPQFARDPSANYAIHDVFVLDRYVAHTFVHHQVSDRVRHHLAIYGQAVIRSWARQSYEREDTGDDFERVIPGNPDAAPADDGSTVFFLDANTRRDRIYTFGGIQDELEWRFVERGANVGTLRAGVRLHQERERQRQTAGETATDESGELFSDELLAGDAVAGWVGADGWVDGRVRIDLGVRGEALWSAREVLRAEIEDPGTGVTTIGSSDARGEAFHGALLPGVGVGWQVAEPLFAFAGLHRGWSPPQTADAVTDDGTVLRLASESSWNAELGLRARHADLAGLDVTLFRMTFLNQVTAPPEGGASADPFVNGEPTLHQGVETTPWVERGPVRLFGGWTVTDARYTGGPTAGNLLPYAPLHLAHAGARLTAPRAVESQVLVTHVSRQFADPENTADPSVDGLVGLIEPATSIDARIAARIGGRRGGAVSAFVAGKNLTNDIGIASRAPAGIQPAGFRTWQLGVEGELR